MDPGRLVIDGLCQQELHEEDEVQGEEGNNEHRVVVEWSIERQLFGGEHDDVAADEDAQIADEVEQVHPDSDVLLRHRRILLLVLALASQLDLHADHSSEDGKEGSDWERQGEEQNPA